MVMSTIIIIALCLITVFILLAIVAVVIIARNRQIEEEKPQTFSTAAMAPATLPDDFNGQILTLMQQGRKIDAVKHYRQYTNVGLKEAKEAVEAMERGEPITFQEPVLDASWQTQVAEALWQGRKIEAIKIYRQATGVGLKEAKEAVEAMEE